MGGGALEVSNAQRSVAVRRSAFSRLALVVALSAGFLLPNITVAAGQSTDAEVPPAQTPRHHRPNNLDDRVKALSKALDLDAAQQSELRRVLERQREQIKRVWSDPSIPADYRASAVKAISDGTADQIRALLNEEQRKKYPAKLPPEPRVGAGQPSVEDWMNAAKPK
jgi:Spy/CpxP family protein refolding chaperone